eukprot:TRINITY_DN36784_c0_g1_i1.p1 TRINITY_DN36784_c0_g1~~TRINITY_DN36784_c0_g1_i1.p1  ORF type:complete len:155 (+),score=40.10 TRINITY_DN36784_c0_g1_i1:129-593(+)
MLLAAVSRGGVLRRGMGLSLQMTSVLPARSRSALTYGIARRRLASSPVVLQGTAKAAAATPQQPEPRKLTEAEEAQHSRFDDRMNPDRNMGLTHPVTILCIMLIVFAQLRMSYMGDDSEDVKDEAAARLAEHRKAKREENEMLLKAWEQKKKDE